MTRFFDQKNIILAQVEEKDLNSFLVSFDIDDEGNLLYQLDKFTEAIINVIPEYVFASYEDPNIPQHQVIEKLREAAKSIYKIKDFELLYRYYVEKDDSVSSEIKPNNRGEFGELILHLLLRDFKGTIPLISKVYFKDSTGVPAHGFDAVHISPDEKILWLGESKFYQDGKGGLKELLKDLETHFKKDYLEEQFTVVKKNLSVNQIPQREEWIEVLNTCTLLKEKVKMINIPMLCTYEHDIYSRYSDLQCEEAVQYHESNIRDLKKYFDDHNKHPLKNVLNVILFLFPIQNKKELVKKLHERLYHLQSI